ncbi:MAG: tetratricopeptide repeat protein [Cyanobacteria bacterium P01_A01_bin.15]
MEPSPMELSKFNQRELAKLIVSVRASAGRLDLLMAICDDRQLQETLIDRYEAVMKTEGMAVYRASLAPNNPSLKASLAELVKYNTPLQSGGNALVTVLGAAGLFGVRLNQEKSEREKFFFSLQWTRESLRGFEFPVVLWLSGAVAKGVAQQAQDFWSWRGGVFEFERQEASYGEAIVDAARSGAEERTLGTNGESGETGQRLADLEQQIKELQQQNENSPLLGTLYDDLGDAYRKLSVQKEALQAYGQALDHIKAADQGQRAEILVKLGKTLRDCRRFQPAAECFKQALELFEELADLRGQLNAYFQLGNIATDQREFEQAREYYQQTLEIETGLEDREGQASTYHQLGRVAQELREYEQARSHYQQALAIYIEFNDRYEQAGTYHQLGIVAQELREYEQARSHYQQALAICIEFNDRYSQARTYHQLGIVAQALREYEQARSHYQQALAICLEFNDRYNQAKIYHQLGIVAQELQEYEQARSHYQQALAIKVELNDRYSQASTYHQLGRVAQELREYEQAHDFLQQALAIFIESNDQHNAEIALNSLARIYRANPNHGIVQQVATVLNEPVDAVQQRFAALNTASADEQNPPAEA